MEERRRLGCRVVNHQRGLLDIRERHLKKGEATSVASISLEWNSKKRATRRESVAPTMGRA